MAVFVADVLADLTLCKNGVTGDNRAFERQAFEQHHGGRDLVLIGLDRQIADHHREIGRKCRKDVGRLRVQTPAALERFAINGDVIERAVATRECAQRLAQGVCIKRLKK